MNELDGLAKGSRVGQYATAEHAAMVQRSAAAAVTFLEEQFASSKQTSHLRILTAKGSVLHTIAYRSEEEGPEVGYEFLKH